MVRTVRRADRTSGSGRCGPTAAMQGPTCTSCCLVLQTVMLDLESKSPRCQPYCVWPTSPKAIAARRSETPKQQHVLFSRLRAMNSRLFAWAHWRIFRWCSWAIREALCAISVPERRAKLKGVGVEAWPGPCGCRSSKQTWGADPLMVPMTPDNIENDIQRSLREYQERGFRHDGGSWAPGSGRGASELGFHVRGRYRVCGVGFTVRVGPKLRWR